MVVSGSQIGLCAFFTIGLVTVGGSLMTAILVRLGRIRLGLSLQKFPRASVAAVHPLDGHGLPGIVLFHLRLFQHHLGILPIHRQHPFLGFGHRRCHVMLHFHTPCVYGSILRIQGGLYHLSHGYIFYRTLNLQTHHIHEAHLQHLSG